MKQFGKCLGAIALPITTIPVHSFLAIKIHFTGKTAERQEKRNGKISSTDLYILPSRALYDLK